MTFGHQTELFDATGQVTAVAPAVRPEPAAVPAAAKPAAPAVPQTVVSVHSRSRTTARVVATTRGVAATRVAAVSKAAAARGEVGRHLMMSQSLSSGREESRWFSVPQRILLPRYQLFEGADAVVEEETGRFRVGSPSTRSQRGRVWFV